MIGLGEVEALASLARLSLTTEEKEKLQKDLESILGYVSELGKIEALASEKQDLGLVKNVFREDVEPHETGKYTEAILAEASRVKDNFVEVKKILDNGK